MSFVSQTEIQFFSFTPSSCWLFTLIDAVRIFLSESFTFVTCTTEFIVRGELFDGKWIQGCLKAVTFLSQEFYTCFIPK